MKKQKTVVRKRTVTVVVGAGSEELLCRLVVAYNKRLGCELCTLTTVVGAILDEALKSRSLAEGLSMPSGWRSHFS